MTNYTLPKHYSDVHWQVVIRQRKDTNNSIPVAIATCSGKDVTTTKIYGDLDEVSADYDETTEVYAMANGIFNASNFTGCPLEIIDCAKDQQPDNANTAVNAGSATNSATSVSSASATSNSASNATGLAVTPTMINGIVAGVRDHIYDDFYFLLVATGNLSNYGMNPDDVVTSLMDLAYQSQQFYFFYQSSSIQNLDTYYNYAQNLATSENKFANSAFFFDNTGHQVAANAAAYMGASVASGNTPIDGAPVALEHIANEVEFVPSTTLSRSDSDHLDATHVNYVVTKAGDNMVEGGKGAANDWVDHFVNFKKVYDAYTWTMQKYLNDHDWPEFDDFHMNEAKQQLVNTDNQLFKESFLQNVSPIEFKPAADVPARDINERIYRFIKISPQLADPFDQVSGTIVVTV